MPYSRQPGGFEGGGPIRVLERVHDPAVAHLPMRVGPQVDLDSGSPAASADVEIVPTTFSPAHLRSSTAMECPSQVSSQRCRTPFAPSTPRAGIVLPSSIGYHTRSGSGVWSQVSSSSWEGFETPPHNLHVLLRHRLLPQPAASRASAWLRKSRERRTFPPRKIMSSPTSWPNSMPVVRPVTSK